MKKRVMIGIPAFAGVDGEILEDLMCLAFHLGRREPEYDFFLKVISKKEQFRARNFLVNMALAGGMDYLWMLDDDMVIPPNAFSRLIAHGKEVTGALYYQRTHPYNPVMLRAIKGARGTVRHEWIHDFKRGLIPVDVIGGGCMLFDMKVFKNMPEPYFWIDGIIGTDIYICTRLKELGYQPYCDTTLELGHLGERQVVTGNDMSVSVRKFGSYAAEFVSDVQEYLHMTPDMYEEKVSYAIASREVVWNSKKRGTPEEIASYYREQGAMNILSWSWYNTQDKWSRDFYPQFMEATWLKALGVKKILEFGCGLSLLGVSLCQQGFELTCADLPNVATMDFAKWRAKKYDIASRFIDLLHGIPACGKQDAIMLFDVIEHLPDPWNTLNKLMLLLNSKGVIITDAHMKTFAGAEQGSPQHLKRYDRDTFALDLCKKFNMVQSLNNPYLFRRAT